MLEKTFKHWRNLAMPIIKLTKTNVDKIPYTEKGQVLYHDENLKGFVLRVGKSTKTYCAYNTVNRKSRQINIGRHGVFTVEQARAAAKEKLYLMAQGIDPEEKERTKNKKQITLNELVEEFITVRNNIKPKTKQDYRYYVRKYLPDWADKPVINITEKIFLDRYLKIGKENGKAVANNVRRYVGSLMNYAIAAHNLYDNNPAEIIRKTRSAFPDKRRTNIIAPSQLGKWWEAVEDLGSPDLSDYLKLVILTGVRREEASRLKWPHISFDEKTITIPETKNGEVLRLPMGDYLYNLLKTRAKDAQNDWVFPSYGKRGHIAEPRKAVERVRKTSGIYFTVHDLRRTYMTIAASLDISAYALKRLVNHKTSHDVTGGYIVLGIEQLREPVQKIENYILGKVDEQKRDQRGC